jgi:hypothetical protein
MAKLTAFLAKFDTKHDVSNAYRVIERSKEKTEWESDCRIEGTKKFGISIGQKLERPTS